MSTPSRQPKGIPTGGQFAASAKAESDVTLHDSNGGHGRIDPATAVRLDAYDRLKDFGIDGTVTTLTWPEEPNEDGTFDVDLNVLYDSHGNEVETLGGQGAMAAGWLDESNVDGYATAFDIWREDPSNPNSDIDLQKMQAWYAEHSRAAALERLNRLTTVDENGRRWVETEDAFWEAERARLEAYTSTSFADLAPDDRFVIEKFDGFVECRVLGVPFATVDRFQRPMTGIMVRRQDSGAEGVYTYGPEGVARKVEKPVTLRVGDPDKKAQALGYRSNEHMLNEAWGV